MPERSRPLQLILTIDYELFGNGSGSLGACVRKPAASILSTAAKFDVPVTFFVEALEFRAIEEGGETGNSDTLAAIKAQLREAHRNGHDVQLHIHPQWLTAVRNGDRGWQVDLSKWRTGDLSREDLLLAIRGAREWLQALLSSVNPTYEPSVFRAGGWCVQPADLVLQILAAEGFRIESSVAPGTFLPTPHAWYDYRVAPADRSHWPIVRDVCQPEVGGALTEVPIATGRLSRAKRVLGWLNRRRDPLAPDCRGTYTPAGTAIARLSEKLARVRGQAMLDISTLDVGSLCRITRDWAERTGSEGETVPVVAIGHTKNFSESARGELERFLAWASKEKNITFGTYASWLDTIDQ